MQMIRRFHSVGQGAFYTECFENGFNVVYDCGTSSRKDYLIREINDAFKKDSIINALFLSHLHSDHINGLEYLLDNFRVEKIFIPLLTEENKILMLLKNLLDNNINEFIIDLIMRPQEAINDKNRQNDNNTRVIYINEYDSNDNEQEDSYYYPDDNRNVLKSGEKVVAIKNKWIYVPFNFRHKSRIEQLKKALVCSGIDIPSNDEEAIDLIKDPKKRDLLIDIFRNKVLGDLNTNSMTLYSGLHNEHHGFAYHLNLIHTRNMCCRCCIEPGCLYLGDYNLSGTMKWKDFINNYNRYINSVGIIQIPHHGSKYNYNTQISKLGFKDYIISAGIGNMYNHPHASVIKDILFSGNNLRVVSEKIGSSMVYLIWL